MRLVASPTATAAATTVAATTAAATTATGSPTAAIFTRPCFIDGQRASADLGAVERVDGSLGFVPVGHFDKSKPLRATSVAVDDDLRRLDGPVLLKQLLQVTVGHSIRQVTDIQPLRHFGTP